MGIDVDKAMKASGHASLEMHKRYTHLQAQDIARAFETEQIDKRFEKESDRRRGDTQIIKNRRRTVDLKA